MIVIHAVFTIFKGIFNLLFCLGSLVYLFNCILRKIDYEITCNYFTIIISTSKACFDTA